MKKISSSKGVAILVILLIVLISGAVGFAIQSGEKTEVVQAPPIIPKTVGVDSTGDGEPDKVLELDQEAREVVENAIEAPEDLDLAGDLRGRDDTPVGVIDGPLATPNFPGCQTRFLPTNFSNRTASVKGIGLHYTAGPNRAGWSDMVGLTSYASSPRAGVSWHFLIDSEGHCYYSVPLNKKAWTIGNLNSQTVNIEMIGRGNEPGLFSTTAGSRKLASVVRRIAQIENIPVRLGAVSGCTITRSGIITHWMGGSCAGGHHDIKPYNIANVSRYIASKSGGKCTTVACERRSRHASAHKELKARNCAAIDKTRSERCRFLHRRLRALHKVGFFIRVFKLLAD